MIQLLDKLVSNAVEHSDRNAPIQITVNPDHGKALLRVSNQGEALPEDKQAMFDLFVSFRTQERKTDENFGLGLYIVKLIAESHGGHIAAYDLADKTGAVFEVNLPLLERKLS